MLLLGMTVIIPLHLIEFFYPGRKIQ